MTAARENVCDGSEDNGETVASDEAPASDESPVNGDTPSVGSEEDGPADGEGGGEAPTSPVMSAALNA